MEDYSLLREILFWLWVVFIVFTGFIITGTYLMSEPKDTIDLQGLGLSIGCIFVVAFWAYLLFFDKNGD